jgi:8-oxo-dGTP pyrophosphatase MutT (NUDIX family)
MNKANSDLSWKSLSRKTLLQTPIFDLVADHRSQSQIQKELTFYILDSRDWVNVIAIDTESALDPQARCAWVRQFRVGANQVTWEIPGGACDPGDTDPLQSAQRELFEEFHAKASKWIRLASISPNPALHTNQVHTFLALGCQVQEGPPPGDGHEVLEMAWFPLQKFWDLVDSGEVNHALVTSAFLSFESAKRRGLVP